MRSYEWIIYAWCVLAGGLWGLFSMTGLFVYEPRQVVAWVFFWPAVLDLLLRLRISTMFWDPAIESSLIGAVGVCLAGYVLLTLSHVREEA